MTKNNDNNNNNYKYINPTVFGVNHGKSVPHSDCGSV